MLNPPRPLFRTEPEITQISSLHEAPTVTASSQSDDSGAETRQKTVAEATTASAARSANVADQFDASDEESATFGRNSPESVQEQFSKSGSIAPTLSPVRRAITSAFPADTLAQIQPPQRAPEIVSSNISVPLESPVESRLTAQSARDLVKLQQDARSLVGSKQQSAQGTSNPVQSGHQPVRCASNLVEPKPQPIQETSKLLELEGPSAHRTHESVKPERQSAQIGRAALESKGRATESLRDPTNSLEERPRMAKPISRQEQPAARPSQATRSPGGTVGPSASPHLRPPAPSAPGVFGMGPSPEHGGARSSVVIRSLSVRVVNPTQPPAPGPLSALREAKTIVQPLSRGFQVYGLPQGY